MIRIKIHNLKNLRRAFEKAPDDLSRQMATAVQKSGFEVERESKKVTPVDTGTLRRSIRTKSVGGFTVHIAPHTEYAIYVSEGTRYMRGRPFMKWGLEAAVRTIEYFFNQAVDKVVKNIARRS